jgi:hypothetical protein
MPFPSPLLHMDQTPEFLCWAVERTCPLRELLPENQPEKVERQLRAARYTAEAIAEGRVQNDTAISADGTMAFRVSEAVAMYGGEGALAQYCHTCPANALNGRLNPSYAGCYGLFPVPEPRDAFLTRTQKFPRNHQLFPPTQYLWFGWWVRSPLGKEQTEYLAQVFHTLRGEPAYADNQPLQDLAAALQLCLTNKLPLSVQLFPAGRIEGTWWNLVPHCGICHAPWEAGSTLCTMCGQSRHPASPKKRRVRGIRPYRRLPEPPNSAVGV